MANVRIGNVEIRAVVDANVLMNPHYMFPAHAESMVGEFPEYFDERRLALMKITTFVLRSAGKTIIIDTGLGPRKRPNFPGGNLDRSLAEAGISPEEIDVVVHTHLHIDHVGWNTCDGPNGESQFFFPNARYAIQQAEWDFWMQPDKVDAPGNEYLAQCVEPLRHSGRVDFYDGEAPLDENITLVPTPGHTPGHVAIGVYSAGERGIIVGDASHHPMQLNHPDWSPGVDVDPEQSARTRDRLFDDAANDGRMWLAGHWPEPGIGRIVRLDGKRVFRAL